MIRREKVIGSRARGTSKSLEMKWSGPHRIISRVKTGAHVYNVRFASGKENTVPEHLLRPISDQTRFRDNKFMLTNYINPEYVIYSVGDLVAYRPIVDIDSTVERDPSLKAFRLGEILYITYEGNDQQDLEETYKIHVFGVAKEAERPNRKQRLNLAHKPLYVHAERSQGYNKPYTFAEARRDDNRAFEIEIKKAQLLNIPPLRLTEARKIKPKDKQLINSYFRDFYKDRTEHNKALERARQRRAEQEALGRRNSTRIRKEPERLIEVNSINLTAEALTRDSEELEYYYRYHDVGHIIKEVLQSTNIYK